MKQFIALCLPFLSLNFFRHRDNHENHISDRRHNQHDLVCNCLLYGSNHLTFDLYLE